MLPVDEIEKAVKEKAEEALSVVHAFDHLKRTAIGAKWFAGLMGASEEEAEKSYLCGLLHDIYRPPSAEAHDASLEKDYEEAKKILNRFNLPEKVVEEIALPIKKHRASFKGNGIIHQCVFLADKILENMGAIVVFRRSIYIGENPKYKGVLFEEATKMQYERGMKKYDQWSFPERFTELFNYQHKWPVEYFEAFRNREKWAVRLEEYCRKRGESKGEFVESVGQFGPIDEKDKEYKEETLQYIKGQKFKFFEGLIK